MKFQIHELTLEDFPAATVLFQKHFGTSNYLSWMLAAILKQENPVEEYKRLRATGVRVFSAHHEGHLRGILGLQVNRNASSYQTQKFFWRGQKPTW